MELSRGGIGFARGAAALTALAAAASLFAVLPASAAARQESIVINTVELTGSNGYSVEVIQGRSGGFPPRAAIDVERQGLRASYEVPADSDSGMHATFGSLGRLSFDFSRRKRTVDRRGKGCVWVTETGVFRGDFSFVGEGGYTAAAAGSAPGEVLRLPNGFCGFDDRIRLPFPVPDALRQTLITARAPIPHGFVEFTATAPRSAREPSRFDASTLERVGAMKISRSASATARDGLTLGPGKHPGRADVAPPAPFQGTASFSAQAGARPLWTGSLSVELPGAPATALVGDDFTARLCADVSPLADCPAPPRR